MYHLQYFCLKFGLRILVQDKELEELLLADPNSGVYFPVSCQEYADTGATQNGSYRVQPNANISRKYILLPLTNDQYETIYSGRPRIRHFSACHFLFIHCIMSHKAVKY